METITMALQGLVFEQPPSKLVRLMPLMTVISLSYFAFSEFAGNHLQYSKFWNANTSTKSNQIKLSSKIGMLILYTPAFLAGLASLVAYPDGDFRFFMVKLAITFHFFKRDLEVLFVHKYSGGMTLNSTIIISATYLIAAINIIYVQKLVLGLPEPSTDLKILGILVYLIGIFGNFYHHYLLANLRAEGEKGYKIPKGGLFSLVICPHYLFEILVFVGIFFMSQTLQSLSTTVGLGLYLIGRSYTTRNWYVSKFENFPKSTKAVIPFVF